MSIEWIRDYRQAKERPDFVAHMSEAKKDTREERHKRKKERQGEKEREIRSSCKGNDVDACVFLKYMSTQFRPLPTPSPPSPPFPTPWKGARQYISLPHTPSYLTSLRVLTLSILLLSLSPSLCFSATSRRFQRWAYAPINVPRTHVSRIHVYTCLRAGEHTLIAEITR